MRVDQVESIIARHHPDVKDWEGKKAELAVLAYLCKTEEEVLARIANSSDDYRELLLMVDRIIESVEAEELVEFMVRMWQFREGKTETVIPGQVTRFIEENISQYNRAQIRAMANCATFMELQELLSSDNFKELTEEDTEDEKINVVDEGQSTDERILSLGWEIHNNPNVGTVTPSEPKGMPYEQMLKGILDETGEVTRGQLKILLTGYPAKHREGLLEAFDKKFNPDAKLDTQSENSNGQGGDSESRAEMVSRLVVEIIAEHGTTTTQEFRRHAMLYPKDMQDELIEVFTQVLTAAHDHQKGTEDSDIKK